MYYIEEADVKAETGERLTVYQIAKYAQSCKLLLENFFINSIFEYLIYIKILNYKTPWFRNLKI